MNGKAKLEKGCKIATIMDCDYDEIKGVKVGDTFEYRGKDSFGLHEFGPDYERWGRVGGLTGFTLAEEDMADFYGWCRVLAKDSE